MLHHLLFYLLPLTDGPLFLAAPPAPTVLSIRVTGLKSDRGWCCLALYQREEGFPTMPQRAWRMQFVPIRNREAVLDLSDLPAGRYAVAAYHDENGNRRMDTNLLGLPKEGYAASNNPRPKFGPPSYEQASFYLAAAPLRLELHMVY
ncbi:DUF2141 domain-containing protein [Hymenobacter sp. BT664]|uniref:DUF2141 domain-containing protein n=1 Tax=Hymenobacter montanus TaxID=2771359 RepID=A0A927GKQ0_9BACT|nr:DUF2141 domain-containing protein [Hymenobacter montanus]MBD2769797.1 DUF2141 domain-containing protein [Hymenobacter montanus]